jgi:RNA polymerase sigma-54 factor
MWVVKAIGQRQKTIERLVSAIVRRQSSFFAGCGPLAPMRMRDVARELHVHESTVSRAVNGKYLQCKRGVFPLKYFLFQHAVRERAGAGRQPFREGRTSRAHSLREL